ncbi:flagellar hook basal-body protein [Aestuariivita sp.]|uniref:flagellar hook basal-body protein n=1 Tax=Aestuariivita sp. TaxID=1872407 RepID=UPI002172E091|nr:flagellar hook basal-body protein [Aestuariivita sp.]MCE8008962.1 flagellar hook basal-body protein [Aestuariivita sp.]
MSSANHVSLSLATVLERSLNSTAHNIANMSTSGFKASRPLLDSLTLPTDSSLGSSISFVQDKGNYLDLTQGAMVKTDSPFDVALSGPDWFAYQAPDGTEAFGRDGRLVISSEGELTTTTGAAILDADGRAITLPPDIGATFTIARDGTITDTDGGVLGQIGTFAIETPNALSAIGGGLYILPPGAGGRPERSDASAVVQGFVEQSNVQSTLEVTRMMDIQRAYERAVRVLEETDQLTQTAIQRISRSV